MGSEMCIRDRPFVTQCIMLNGSSPRVPLGATDVLSSASCGPENNGNVLSGSGETFSASPVGGGQAPQAFAGADPTQEPERPTGVAGAPAGAASALTGAAGASAGATGAAGVKGLRAKGQRGKEQRAKSFQAKGLHGQGKGGDAAGAGAPTVAAGAPTVSYTHLTLPTICSV